MPMLCLLEANKVTTKFSVVGGCPVPLHCACFFLQLMQAVTDISSPTKIIRL